MFSSSNSVNPFPQLPPCFHLSPPSFLGHDGQEIFIHHRPDLLSGNSPVTDTISGMAVSNNATTGNQETGTGHHYSPQDEVPKKKDRHSKIYTAQGPRDRRVRLSIEIARNFFDLQDTLGFDKASKTIDWLLSKSKTAIKELNQTKQSLSTGLQGIVSKTKPLKGVAKEKKIKQQNAASFHLLAKRESRARARARARERTREKMCKRRLNDSIELPADSNPLVLNQIEARERGRSHITEGSMVIKSKLKPSSIFSDEQSLSNDVRSHNIPKNWDIVGTITHPSFCAVTSMNLLPEFQICSKPWEVCDKRRKC